MTKSKKRKYTVTVPVPEGVKDAAVCKHIKAALASHSGDSFDPLSATVSAVKEPPKVPAKK